MHFTAAASLAILACASSAAAKPQPYKLALRSVPGLSLSRRDTFGYQPEETVCGDGNTCAEACGQGFTQCPSNDAAIHCFNPEADQSCCTDGTGNSCESGYYCTHDTQLQTWCCPDSMDLAECAAAYSVTGGLETPEPTTSTPTPTSTSTSTTPTPTSTTSSIPTPSSSTTPVTTTTTPCTTSTAWTSSWSSANTTVTVGTSSTTVLPPPGETSDSDDDVSEPTTTPEPTGAASASGVSFALLLAAAGAAALF